MKNILNRGLSALLALALCLSLWVVVPAPEADAVGYVANWGVRGELATELSSYAVSFYHTAGVTYSGLSALNGSSTLSSVPNSPLFVQLQTIMQTYHTYETDYDETKNLYMYTDCQNGDTDYITCIWCGVQYDGEWPYGGDPWNREHTWPKSKSLDGNDPDVDQVDEEDIMLLRPACKGENSSHSNKAYGSTTSDDYFYPNIDKGYGQDARGDIARTMLYVYVRYGNATYMWGSSGVIQSKELLLQWMAEDPVDTWEMGRNDAVQSITGTRNVFIDYPELAFLMFNEEVPADYQTPSGGEDSGTGAAVTVKFLENGVQTSTIAANAGAAFTFPSAKNTPADGYSFVGWVADTVSETTQRPGTIYSSGGSALAANRTYHALYTKVDNTQTGSDYVLHTGSVTEGDYLFIASDGAMSTAANGTAKRRDVIPVTITDNTIYSPDAALIWYITPTTDGYYTFYNAEAKQYAAANGTANQLVMQSSVNDYAKWSISGNVITNKGNQAKGVNYTLRRNSNYGFACYSSDYGTQPVLYKAATGATVYTTTIQGATCQHSNTYLSGMVSATCTGAGYSGDTYCSACGEKLATGSVLPQLEHSYVNGTCSACGAKDPNSGTTENAGDYVLVTPETVTAGNYIIGAVRSGAYPTIYPATAKLSNDWTVSETSVAVVDDTISAGSLPSDAQVVTLTGDNETGFAVGFEVNGTMQYLGYTSTTASRKLALDTQYSTTKWKVVSDPDGGVALASSYGSKSYMISQNSTAATAIRGYYTGTIYTGIYLFRQMEAQVEKPKVAQVGDTQYESFADAYAAATNGQTVKLLATVGEDAPITLNMTHDLYVDLDGWYLYADVTANGYTVYGKDSVTDTYDSENYGAVELTGATVAAQDGYMACDTGNGVSFHAYELKLLAVSLDAANDALGYKAQFFGDEVVCSMVTGFGFHMGVQLQKTYTLDKPMTNGRIFTLRLRNILACNGGEMDITASAFVRFGEDQRSTDPHTTTMRDTIVTVNAAWDGYTADQKNAVLGLYEQHGAIIDGWLGENNNLK